MSKSRDAFRTISEVSDALDTPAHVLRFWESKFSQVKPVKRAGGRRYYRPADLNLLAGIKKLLHDDGMTIKGAQKLLREKGVKQVAQMGADILALHEADSAETLDATPAAPEIKQSDVTDAPVSRPAAPAPEVPAAEVDITNVVSMPPPAPTAPAGPALSINLAPKSDHPADAPSEEAPAVKPAAPDVPDDPADSDSKAPARLFHLLHRTPQDALSRHAAEIAPLLGRMQVLRDRVSAR